MGQSDSTNTTQTRRYYLTTLIALLTIMVSVFAIYQYRAWDLDDRETDSTPKLTYLSHQPGDDGLTIITVKNKPGTGTAAIIGVSFVITDEAVLARIKERHPPHEQLSGMPIHTDTVWFTDGQWDEDGKHYYFSKNVTLQVKPGEPNNLAIGIDNKLWAGFEFRGTVFVGYDNDDVLEIENITIVGKPRPPIRLYTK